MCSSDLRLDVIWHVVQIHARRAVKVHRPRHTILQLSHVREQRIFDQLGSVFRKRRLLVHSIHGVLVVVSLVVVFLTVIVGNLWDELFVVAFRVVGRPWVERRWYSFIVVWSWRWICRGSRLLT
jgi:hypothetical protein